MNQVYETNSELNDSSLKWFVLTSFSLNSMTNIFIFTALSPIWSFVSAYYGTTDYDLNWYTNWYYLCPMTFSFIYNSLVYKNYGLSQIISCALTTIGLWMLYIVKGSQQLGLIGFLLIGLGNAGYCQVPLQLSKIWFQQHQRIISTFIAQYANNLGMFIGYIVSSVYFYNVIDTNDFIQRYETMLFYNALFASISFGFSFITLKTPLNVNQEFVRDSIWISLKKICSTQESIQDIFSASFFIGTGWCYGAFFGSQLVTIGQTTMQINIINYLFQFGQIIMALICTVILSKQSKQGFYIQYDYYIKTVITLGFMCLGFEILFNEYLPFPIICILNIFIGCGLGGLYSILLESLMEKHYPSQELAIGSILQAVACSVSLVLTMLLLMSNFAEFCFQISCFLMIIPFSYITIFYETTFKRFEQEA